MLYIPVNNFSVMLVHFTGLKQRIKCLAQGHDTVPLVGLEPVTPQSFSEVKLTLVNPYPANIFIQKMSAYYVCCVCLI